MVTNLGHYTRHYKGISNDGKNCSSWLSKNTFHVLREKIILVKYPIISFDEYFLMFELSIFNEISSQ